MGESLSRRIAPIGIATVDNPRPPSQVIDGLSGAGAALVNESIQEASRLAAVAMFEIGEVTVDEDAEAATRQIAFYLSALGNQAAERGLVATAEEAAYSLGSWGQDLRSGPVGFNTAGSGILRGVGVQAAEHHLDLVTRQALVSVWSLEAHTTRHMPQSTEVVLRELDIVEQVAEPEVMDSSYLSTSRSPELEEVRIRYLKDIRGDRSWGT